MSKFNGRKVAAATLHGPIHTAETGQIGPKLLAKGNRSSKAVDMELSDGFLVIKVDGREILVSTPNFSHVLLEPEAPKK